MGTKRRISHDLGEAGTRKWLAEWLGDSRARVTVEQFELPCPPASSLGRRDRAHLSQMNAGNQSELHSYLKFVTKRHLEKITPGRRVVSEQGYYSPETEHWMVGFRDTQHIPVRLRGPRFLRSYDLFSPKHGSVYRFDLFVQGTVAEIGGTHQSNLLQPLLDGMATRSFWIPYPNATDYRIFRSADSYIPTANGYEIKLTNGKTEGRQRNVRRAFDGTMGNVARSEMADSP